jgi:hypothetical protein
MFPAPPGSDDEHLPARRGGEHWAHPCDLHLVVGLPVDSNAASPLQGQHVNHRREDRPPRRPVHAHSADQRLARRRLGTSSGSTGLRSAEPHIAHTRVGPGGSDAAVSRCRANCAPQWTHMNSTRPSRVAPGRRPIGAPCGIARLLVLWIRTNSGRRHGCARTRRPSHRVGVIVGCVGERTRASLPEPSIRTSSWARGRREPRPGTCRLAGASGLPKCPASDDTPDLR